MYLENHIEKFSIGNVRQHPLYVHPPSPHDMMGLSPTDPNI